jgi:DNA repair exonuclease SbcCD nuclease subunit
MRILLITDQHFGARNDSQVYVNKYQKFYSETVLPYIDKHKITQVIALGDTFDRRKAINFNSLQAAKDMWFDPLRERDVKMHMLVGNHDIYFKNTLRINSPKLLLGDYDNITVVDDPQQLSFGDTGILLLPWICDENRQRSMDLIENSSASICLGHLELNNFEPIPGYTMEHGDSPDLFSKFNLVCSGHFHHKSRKDNIVYLGNPYQMFWNDYGCDRGFHVLNTDTEKLTFVKNPNSMFHKIYYRDSETAKIDYESLNDSYVKLIVEKKEDQVLFDKTLKQINASGIADLKIVEDTFVHLDEVDEDLEQEDTLSILQNCVKEIDNRDEVFGILKSLYVEALRL